MGSSEVNSFVAGLPAGLASFTYHFTLACLELYCRSVLDLACFFGLSMLPSYCRGVLIALRVNAECTYFVPNAKPALGKLHMSRLMLILFLHFSFVDVPLCFGTLVALLAGGPRFRLLLWALNALLIL